MGPSLTVSLIDLKNNTLQKQVKCLTLLLKTTSLAPNRMLMWNGMVGES